MKTTCAACSTFHKYAPPRLLRNSTGALLAAVMMAAGVAATPARAATMYFTDAGGPNAWDNGTTGNWGTATGGPYTAVWTNGNSAVFEGTGGTVNVSTVTATTLTFNSTGYALTGGTINGLTGITNNAAGTTTINSNIANAGGTLTTLGNSISFGGQLTLGTMNVGNISGSQTVTLTAADTIANLNISSFYPNSYAGGNVPTVVLNNTSGGNAVSGNITLANGNYSSSGMLQLAASNQIADTSIITMANSTANHYGSHAYFALMGFSDTIGGLSYTNGSSNNDKVFNGGNADSVLTFAGTGSNTYQGQISDNNGSGTGKLSIVQNGVGGTQILNNALSYTGTTTVTAGTLSIRNTTFSSSTTTVNGGTLDFQGATVGAAISGTIGQVTITGGSNTNFGGGNKTYGVNTVISGNSTLTQTAANSLSANSVVNIATGSTLSVGNFAGSVAGLSGAGSVTLGGASANLTIAGSGNNTFTGVISGVGGQLTMAGSGTQTLSGANTYAGATTVSGGTLNLANSMALQNSTLAISIGVVTFDSSVVSNAFTLGGLSGSGNLALQNNAGSPAAIALTVGGNNASTTYGGALSAGGSLTKIGTGTLTLTGTNTYTGTTIINAGTLAINGSTVAASAITVGAGGALSGTGMVNGAVTVNAGGGVNLTTDAAVGTLTLGGALTFNGTGTNQNAVSFNLGSGSTGVDTIAATGAVTAGTADSVVVNLVQLGTTITPNTYTLITSSATSNTSGFVLATTHAGHNTYSLATTTGGTGNVLQVTVTASVGGPAAAFWQGGTDGNWSTFGNNWKTSAAGTTNTTGVPGYNTNVTFTTTTPTTAASTLGADFEINSLAFNAAAGGASIGGANTLTLDATNANGNTAGNGITAGNTSGTNTISANVGLGQSQTWTVTSAGGTLAVSGAVSDFGAGYGLTKAGAGTLALTGANTYGGGTTLSAGTLSLGSTTALGSGTLTITGGTLDSSVANLVNANNNAQAWNGDFTFAGTQNLNLGTGAVTLSANRTVTINANTLAVGGAISGAFSLTKAGAGTLTLSGANLYTGTTTVSAGQLNVTGSGTLGATTAALTMNGGILDLGTTSQTVGAVSLTAASTIQNGSLTGTSYAASNATGTATISANLLGGAALTKSGAGTLILSGINTYTGSTTLNASGGTLQIGGAGSLGSGNYASTVSIGSGSTFEYSSSASQTLSGSVSGSGGIAKDTANNTLTLSGAGVNYTGATMVSNGTLALVNTIGFNSATTVNAGGALSYSNNSNQNPATTAGITLAGGSFTGINTTNNYLVFVDPVTLTAASTIYYTSAGGIGNNGLYLDGGVKGTNQTLTVDVTGAQAGSGVVFRTASNTLTGSMIVNGNGTGTATESGIALLSTVGTSLQGVDITLNSSRIEMQQIAGDISWASASASATIGALNGNANAIVHGAGTTLIVGATGNNGSFAGVISGTQAFTKTGAGTQILTGTNTYTGTTTVNGGTLLVNGTNNAGSTAANYTITGSTSNLGGAGTIKSTNAAGISISGSGNIIGVGANGGTVAGTGLTLNAPKVSLTSTYLFDVNYGSQQGDVLTISGATAGAGQVKLGGSLTLGNGLASAPAAGTSYKILILSSNVAASNGSGTLYAAGQSNYQGTVNGIQSYQSIVTWDGGKTFYLVPEPASFMLLSLGSLLLLRRPSRRRGRTA